MKARRKISTTEAAHYAGVSRQRMLELLKAGRIQGAEQVGSDGRWAIPAKIVILEPKHRGRPQKPPGTTRRKPREVS